MSYLKNYFYIFLCPFLLALLHGCASQQAPGGGPVDKVPPEIIACYPKNLTTNFKDDYFELTFSEWVDKSSVKEAVFISPSVEGALKYEWSGKTVRVYFPKPLKDSVTYIVTVGTDLYDLNNRNKMAEAFSIAFTKGDKIDRCSIDGKIFGEKTEGTLVFAYKKHGAEIDPSSAKPDYVSQTGKNGKFRMTGLAEGEYRILAVKNEFREFKYRACDDMFGAAQSDIKLGGSDSLFSGLEFFMSKEDTVRPRLLSAVMTDANHIVASFSKEPDSSSISSFNYSVYDSTANKSFPVRFAYKGKTKPAEIALALSGKLPEKNDLFLLAKNITDINGNRTLSDAARLAPGIRPDTLKPSLYETRPSNRSTGVDPKSDEFFFFFDDAFDTLLAGQGIEISSGGRKLDFKIKFIDDASFKIKISSVIKPNEEGMIKLDLKKFTDAAGNRSDSVYKYTFKTGSGMDYSAASGTMAGADTLKSRNVMMIMQGMDKDKRVYKNKVKKDMKFRFEKIKPGKYILWSFIDADGDEKYSYGRPYPFRPSEKFTFYPDTLNLRARWPVEDINVRYKK